MNEKSYLGALLEVGASSFAVVTNGVWNIYNRIKPVSAEEILKEIQKTSEQLDDLEAKLEEEETEITQLQEDWQKEREKFEINKKNVAKINTNATEETTQTEKTLDNQGKNPDRSNTSTGTSKQPRFFSSNNVISEEQKDNKLQSKLTDAKIKQSELDQQETALEEKLGSLEISAAQLLEDQEVFRKQLLTISETLVQTPSIRG